jgi:serine/threonine protein kinase
VTNPAVTTCPSCAAETKPSASVCAACGGVIEPPGLQPGAVVAGRYEVEGRLGAGGMGVVYKARDRMLDEVVALKVLRGDGTGSDEMARRFRSEIRLARAVSHRNVCRIHEYGEEGDFRYVSMAYVDGVDLRRMLRDRGRFSGEDAASLTVQVAEALEAIHAEGIVHRDLKPGNVMVDGRGVARVMDFGIAKQWENAAAVGMTGTGMLVGTPTYMSPEQIRGDKLDGRSDLYSLGIVMFELVTGRTPFRGDTPLAMLFKHINEPPPLHGPEAALIPGPIVPVLERALAKDRDQRYASAREMADALAQAGRECAETGLATGTIAPLPRVLPGPSAGSSASSPSLPRASAVTARGAVTEVPALTIAGSEPAVAPVPMPPPARSRAGVSTAAAIAAVAVLIAVALAFVATRSGRSTDMVVPATTIVAAPPPPSSLAAAPVAGAPVAVAPTTLTPAATVPVAAPVAKTRPSANAGGAPHAAPDLSSAAAMAGLLAEADAALGDHALELAGSLYDQVLAIDPSNEKARAGRARVAEALARPPAAAPTARRFVAGQTRADFAPSATAPAGFDGAGVAVRRVEGAQAPAGKIYFEMSPPAVGPGERYVVRAYLVNESAAAIDVADVSATTVVNGRRSGGRVDSHLRPIAPTQKAVVLETQDVWGTETATWALTVTVRTARGESYTNQLTWE